MKNTRFPIIVTSLGLLCLSACFETGISGGGKKTVVPTREQPEGGVVLKPIEEPVASVKVGIKNYEQINRSMSRLTGIDPFTFGIQIPGSPAAANNVSIQTVFEIEYKGIMPANNDIGGFNGNAQMAITKLAFHYCDILAGRRNEIAASSTRMAGIRQAVIPQLNAAALNATPASEFPDDVSLNNKLVDPILDAFWGDSVDSGVRSKAQAELLALARDVRAQAQIGEGAQRHATQARDLVKAVCLTALSSSPVVLY